MEIYLDNAATTKPLAESVAACVHAMETEYGNPSSLHRYGFLAEQLLNKSKATLAKALFCDSGEIVFTSGATESNNLALIGAVCGHRKGTAHPKIITTAIEHPSILKPLEQLADVEIVKLMPQNGRYTAEQFYEAVDENTILVSAMWVNNETGLILPIAEIAEQVKRKNENTLFHCDGVQGFLKQPLKLKNTKIDLFSVSGHKIGAPKGIGALYIKKGVYITPQILGGGQQNSRRSGTEPMPMIAAFAEAVSVLSCDNAQRERYKKLKLYLIELLNAIDGVTINQNESCLYADNILSITVNLIRSETMLHFLEQFDIYVSSGSACSKGKQSHVLSALSMNKQNADCTIRVSFFSNTTEEMLKTFSLKLKEGIDSLAKIR